MQSGRHSEELAGPNPKRLRIQISRASLVPPPNQDLGPPQGSDLHSGASTLSGFGRLQSFAGGGLLSCLRMGAVACCRCSQSRRLHRRQLHGQCLLSLITMGPHTEPTLESADPLVQKPPVSTSAAPPALSVPCAWQSRCAPPPRAPRPTRCTAMPSWRVAAVAASRCLHPKSAPRRSAVCLASFPGIAVSTCDMLAWGAGKARWRREPCQEAAGNEWR